MTSAVSYDPEDFDNNPFADNGAVSSAFHDQDNENDSNESVHSNSDNESGDDNVVNESSNGTDSGSSISKTSVLPIANQNTNSNTATTTSSTISEFSEYPTENDLRRYLPERLHKDEFQMIIKIQEIEANGSNSQKNPIFNFNAKVVKLSGFRKDIYKNVRRTYKEFESLYKYLTYNNIEVFVPSLPTISTLYSPMSTEFVSSVTNLFQDWLNRICSNPILIKNKEFALFFEQNDFSYVSSKTKPSTNSIIATGLRRKTLKQFQPPYDSCDYLARYRPLIKEVYLNCQKLLEKLEKYLKYQRQTAFYNNEFINILGDMENIEKNEEMSKLWKKFFKFSLMFNEVDLVKNASLTSELIGFFKQISDDTYNIKESLTNRHLLMRELISAEEATKKKHAVIEKLKMKSAIDPIKVDEAIRGLELSHNYEKELRFQVKRTTYEMLIESKEYLDYMVLSAKKLFKILAKHQIIQERKKLNSLINNRLINQQDSLGRLGREYLPDNVSNQTKNITSSQQDSWNSRVKKQSCETAPSNNTNVKDDLNDDMANINAKSAASLLASSKF